MQNRRLAGALLLLAACGCLVLTATGCSSGRRATVTGKVTYQGKPLTSGTVMFYTADGSAGGSASIMPDGMYKAADVPVGEVTATVRTIAAGSMPKGEAKPGGAPSGLIIPGKGPAGGGDGAVSAPSPGTKVIPGGEPGVAIPEKYGKPTLSGLKYTVTGGTQTIDIPLS